MDIALAVEYILPSSNYFGSTTANTEDAWDSVVWNDLRIEKPTWSEIQTAWSEYEVASYTNETLSSNSTEITAEERSAAITVAQGIVDSMEDGNTKTALTAILAVLQTS